MRGILTGLTVTRLRGPSASFTPYLAARGSELLSGAALTVADPGSASFAAAGYLTINFVLGNMVEPKLMGRRLGLSKLVVFFSLVFWGSLLGPVGMVLCIPLTMTLKFACENSKGWGIARA
jgi:predicted PurR-regulated permease PerM